MTIFKGLFYDTFIKWFKRIQLLASMTLNVFPRRKFERNSPFDLFLSFRFSAAQTKTWLKERKKNSGLPNTRTINTDQMTLSGDFPRTNRFAKCSSHKSRADNRVSVDKNVWKVSKQLCNADRCCKNLTEI